MESRINRTEIALLLSATILLLIGIAIDITGFSLFPVEVFHEYLLTAIQIQATISTLGLSFIAIIGNTTAREEYGVSVSDFIMNRRTRLFSQKNVIIISLLLVLLSLFEFARQHYNLVCCSLVVEVFFVVYQINNISLVFKTQSTIRDCIFEQEILGLHDKDGIENFFSSFVEMDSPSESRAKDYQKKALTLVDKYLSDKEHFVRISDGVSRMVSKLLVSDSRNLADMGVDLLYRYYLMYEKYKIKYSDGFEYGVFSYSFPSINDAIEKVSASELQTLYKMIPFIILRAQTSNEMEGIDVRDAINVSWIFAWNSCRIGDSFLRRTIEGFVPEYSDSSFLRLGNEENNKTSLLVEKAAANYYLSYANEVIRAGRANILSKVCVRHIRYRLHEIDRIHSYYVIGLVVLCIYYSLFEKTEELSDSVKDGCSTLLKSNWKEIRSFLSHQFYCNHWNCDDVINIKTILHDKEYIPRYEGKFVVMDEVVHRVIIVLYALCDGYYSNQFDKAVEELFEKEGDYNYRFFVEHPQKAKEFIGSFVDLTDNSFADLKDEEKQKRVDGLFSTISVVIERNIRKSMMTDSKKALEMAGDFEEIKAHIKEELEKYVSDKTKIFESSLSGIVNEDSKMINLLETNVPVGSFSLNDFLGYLHGYIDNNLCVAIINALRKRLSSIVYDIADETSIEELLEQLSSYDSVVGISSLWTRYYKSQKQYGDLLDSKKSLIVGNNNLALCLFDSRTVSIDFGDYSVDISEYAKDEIKSLERKEGDHYIISVTSDMCLKYSEEELFEYYHYNKRKMTLKCRIRVKCLNDIKGVFVHGK